MRCRSLERITAERLISRGVQEVWLNSLIPSQNVSVPNSPVPLLTAGTAYCGISLHPSYDLWLLCLNGGGAREDCLRQHNIETNEGR